jgi:hypothetical protein
MPKQKVKRSPNSNSNTNSDSGLGVGGGGASSRRDKEGSTTSSLRNEWVDGDGDEEGEGDMEEEGGLPVTPTPTHAKPAEQLNNVTHETKPDQTRGSESIANSNSNSNPASASAIDDKDDEGDWASYARRQRQSRGFGMAGGRASSASLGASRRSVGQKQAGSEPQSPVVNVNNGDVGDVDRQQNANIQEKKTIDTIAGQEPGEVKDQPLPTRDKAESIEESPSQTQPGVPETEDAADPIVDSSAERPARLQRMASMASSILTMDNEDEDDQEEEVEREEVIDMDMDVDMDVNPSTSGQVDIKNEVDPVLDPALTGQSTGTKDSIGTSLSSSSISNSRQGQGRKPSTSSSSAVPPNMDSVKKTRRSSKNDASALEDEKPVVARQPAVLEEEELEVEGAAGGDITRCVCKRGGESGGFLESRGRIVASVPLG